MLARTTFLGIVAFWLTMNVLLWRMEFGARGGDTPVPPQLVWRKILTAPDHSSLNVYQNGERTGYCELSTGVSQQMAAYDENKLPVAGFAAAVDYRLHVSGNIALGNFTNRLKFDTSLRFDHARQLQELQLRIISHTTVVEIHSLMASQTAHVKISTAGLPVLERNLAFTDFQNPAALVQALAGDVGGGVLGAFDPAGLLPALAPQPLQWDARRTRFKVGADTVPAYRLETSLLGRTVTMDVSTLGEILHLELPGALTAQIEEWGRP